MVDYLRLFAEADYARPLARERTVALELLAEVADAPGADAAVAAGRDGAARDPARRCGGRGRIRRTGR